MKELQYLNKYFIKYKFHFLLGIFITIVAQIFSLFTPKLVSQSFEAIQSFHSNNISSDIIKAKLIENILWIIGTTLIAGVLTFLMRQTLIVMSRHVEFDLKNEVFQHYEVLDQNFYKQNRTGDLMNRISEDVGRVRMYLGPSIMYGLQLITLFFMLIPIMYHISPKLTIYALLPLPLLSISIFYVNNIIEHRSEEIQKSQSRLSTFVQEAFSGIRVLKSFTRENESITNFTKESNEYKRQSLKLTRVQALFFPLIMGLIGLSTILTVYAGSVEVINGALTFGNIAEFIIYVNLLTWPVTSLGWTSSLVQRAEASQKRINEFLKTKTDLIEESNVNTTISGHVEFANVSFVYPDTGIKALKNVSFQIRPGESLAIIGTTGSGKSTITNLISRLYDVTQGEIKIDGVRIQNYELPCLRSQIGTVPQDVFLFSDTILNNISFGLKQPDEAEAIQAAKDADVYDNIMAFPQGFATRVGERGITLSGGQKQRVSIARAIVREPKILVLDDALSAVDTKTENTILNSMKKIMQNRTSIIISHRVSSAKLANKIIVLHDGAIVEEGTHESLLELNGTYRELYDKQMQKDEVME